MYLPLDLVVYNRLLIEYLGLVSVDKMKKHLPGLNNSLFFSNTLCFTIYGALIMLLHDFHENAFDPK